MPDDSADQLLDRRLTAVSVPPHLLRRLRDIAAWSDEELDLRLRDVAVPADLFARIRADRSDLELDERIRAVPESFRVVPRGRTIPDRRSRRHVRQLALAASLMLVLNLGCLAALNGMLSLVRPGPHQPPRLVVVDRGPLDLVSSSNMDAVVFPRSEPDRSERLDRNALDPITTMPVLAIADGFQPGPAGTLAAEIRSAWDPWDNWLLTRWGVAGYARVEDLTTASLTSMMPPAASGLAAPLSRSFDREFLFRNRYHPPVVTAVDDSAATIAPPLSTETTSFELARGLVGEGRIPDSALIRVEDFLAAVDYDFAPTLPGNLALRTAAGPSAFHPGTARLLQIGVKAGPSPQRGQGGTHLVVALDTSAAMQRAGHWERARQAVEQLLAHLRPGDRLSLVAFADQAVVAVEEAGPGSVPDVFGLLERWETGGGVNLGAGLQAAISAAIETEMADCPTKCLALITASRPVLEPRAAAGIRHLFDEASRSGFRVEVYDLERGAELSDQWLGLASEAPCTVHDIASAGHLRWGLVQSLTGQPSLVASEVALQVQFNPDAVAAYRLIGHEATAVGGLLPASVPSDLHADQEAAVLFELWLYPNADNHIATVRLSWTDPVTGRARRSPPQRVSGLQFANSFEGAPIPLQAAAVAAEAAEVMRQGYNFSVSSPTSYAYFPKPLNLQHVLSAASRVNPKLAGRGSFQRLMRLLETVDSVGIQRLPAAARSGGRSVASGRWRESGG